MKKIAIIGGGWAGLAAAIHATRQGHHATLFEAAPTLGGRARTVNVQHPDGHTLALDNGQHILIGAYSACLDMLRTVGIDPHVSLLRYPMRLQYPQTPHFALAAKAPTPLNVLLGITLAKGWTWTDKWSLLRTAAHWQQQGYRCAAHLSVSALCQDLTPTIRNTLIEPLCVSALNIHPDQASGSVFLRVLQDSLLGGRGASDFLIPTVDLGQLFPNAAADWLHRQSASVHTGARISHLIEHNTSQQRWQIGEQYFDHVVCATAPQHAIPLLQASLPHVQTTTRATLHPWLAAVQALHYTAIATVYAYAKEAYLPAPVLALHSTPTHAPAQFVFDRGQLGGPRGLLAFVISASDGDRQQLQQATLQQAQTQLGLRLHAVQTIVEKRATFACTPQLQRPASGICTGLSACGDYVAGPYPATLEGTVRSALAITH